MARTGTRLTLILYLLAGGAAGAAQLPSAHYAVSVGPDLNTLTVHACFTPRAPDSLIGASHLAARAIRHATVKFGGHANAISPQGHVLALSPSPEDGCLNYSVDLAAIRDSEPGFDAAWQQDGALILGNGTWLWRPASGYRLEFTFDLPPGIALSTPWEATGAHRYRAADTPVEWQGSVMLGRFVRQQIPVGTAELDVAIAGIRAPADLARIRHWLKTAAGEAAGVLGQLPVPRVQVLVMGLRGGRETAAYAATARGGGPALHITYNPALSDRAYRDDWIAVHEFSHLLLPYVDRRYAWLSEGLATYYQEVLRARSGRLSDREAWQALNDGFDRGDRQTNSHLTLNQATRYSAHRGQVMRVYWTGAAIFLLADRQLRTQSHGTQSLDTVLARFNACCRNPDRTWEGPELLDKLDALAGTDLFGELGRRYMYSRYFPNLRPLFADLGVSLERGRVRLDDKAPAAGIRAAIMTPQVEADSNSGHSSGRPVPRQARSQLSGASPSRRLPGAR